RNFLISFGDFNGSGFTKFFEFLKETSSWTIPCACSIHWSQMCPSIPATKRLTSLLFLPQKEHLLSSNFFSFKIGANLQSLYQFFPVFFWDDPSQVFITQQKSI